VRVRALDCRETYDWRTDRDNAGSMDQVQLTSMTVWPMDLCPTTVSPPCAVPHPKVAQMAPHLVLHGHFYQPPRHNPWTEAIPVEPSAAPAHDWNERIDAESYRPNAYARIVDGNGAVVGIVNNYALMSFNVGPTLDQWLAEHAPDTLTRMVAGDRAGGGAIAQPYHHVIMPLSNERDRRTEIRWGLAAFEHRFGRRATGMWLPETAVNDDVLAILVEEGISFTILAPGQAAGHPRPGAVYRWEHPHGRGSISLVFYDGPLSHDVAFGAALTSAEALVDRGAAVADDGLVTVATDGETFGHHHKFTERAVAYALAIAAPRRGLGVGHLARWLSTNPPTAAMAVVESAWSCAHGVGRWKQDCGCSTGGPAGANQKWRAPLRAALDRVRDGAAEIYERRGAGVFHDAEAARDAYIDVLLDGDRRDAFLAAHLQPGASDVEAMTLLESQREAMAMYTSCGWFFWDLAGLETVQVLRHAARCLDLLAALGEDAPIEACMSELANASSNVASEGDGTTVWATHVASARVRGDHVLRRAALSVADPAVLNAVLPAFELTTVPKRCDRGALSLVAGSISLVDRRTRSRHDACVWAVVSGTTVIAGRLGDAGLVADVADHQARFAGGERLAGLVPTGAGWEPLDVGASLPGERDERHSDVPPGAPAPWWNALLAAAAVDLSVLDLCAPRLANMLELARVDGRPAPIERLQELLYDRMVSGPVTADLARVAAGVHLVVPIAPPGP